MEACSWPSILQEEELYSLVPHTHRWISVVYLTAWCHPQGGGLLACALYTQKEERCLSGCMVPSFCDIALGFEKVVV